jgi:uncharacterized membrane protein
VAKLLVVAAIAWPAFLAGGFWSRAHGGPASLTAAAYLVAGRVCHQRPERSFHTSGIKWPVCGRCAGLYLAAPIGALAAFARRRGGGAPALGWLLAAAVPTAVTFVLEFTNLAQVSSLARAIAALPLGAAVAHVIVAAGGSRRSIG